MFTHSVSSERKLQYALVDSYALLSNFASIFHASRQEVSLVWLVIGIPDHQSLWEEHRRYCSWSQTPGLLYPVLHTLIHCYESPHLITEKMEYWCTTIMLQLFLRRGEARQGEERRGKERGERRGEVKWDKARQGKARRGEKRRGEARQGDARQGEARRGEVRRGKARQREERRGAEKRGEARQGKARRVLLWIKNVS